MTVRLLTAAAMTTLLVVAAACSRAASSNPGISLANADSASASVQVTGLSADLLDALEDLSAEQWPAVLRVAVGDDAPAMLGSYSVADGAVRFTPAFPFDPG